MIINTRNTSIIVNDNLMRVYVASPAVSGKYPGIIFYSDIYQLGGPMLRLANYLAGYGYVVVAPEIFHRQLPIGTAIEPNDLGRIQGNEAARLTSLSEFDADAHALIDFLSQETEVNTNRLGAFGFCIGGHLAFRSGFNSEIKATVCCYPTGIHSGKLGRETADTFSKIPDLKSPVLLIFGTQDPHIPETGRAQILQSLEQHQIPHQTAIYEANHTFMRDDGYRYDPVATNLAWGEITQFLSKHLA
ncbi:dienelactone hydrolase family protein [Gloeocapsa sp. PCC 73106]|uniref:dienelactone hydrolase family protein n=1 Tax=Gloeocapsa sp. PCC 73106 TaxID=102232 RepID=UPI0002AC8606|nr:dienelactone hydrolase family protein [Gloeocapsa sp. PCC 73106]ELR97443.1 dienelactone hydrolase-like enzyme [Gloeocapsa sp. PCC 73106]